MSKYLEKTNELEEIEEEQGLEIKKGNTLQNRMKT